MINNAIKQGAVIINNHTPLNDGSFSKDHGAEVSENLDDEDFLSPLPDLSGISDFGVEDNFAKPTPTLGGSATFYNTVRCIPFSPTSCPPTVHIPLQLSWEN